MKKTIVLILTLVVIFLNLKSQNGKISGSVYWKDFEKPAHFVKVVLLPISKEYQTSVGAEFEYNDVKPGVYSLLIDILEFPDTIIENIVVKPDTILRLDVIYKIPYCEFGEWGKWKGRVCPACNDTLNTIPVSYGFPGESLIESAKRGEAYIGGCLMDWCAPHWYCKKDDKLY